MFRKLNKKKENKNKMTDSELHKYRNKNDLKLKALPGL